MNGTQKTEQRHGLGHGRQGMQMLAEEHAGHIQGARAMKQGTLVQKHEDHHSHMASDFKRRFWVCLIVTVPILLLSPFIQKLLGIREVIQFTGDLYLLGALSSFIFFYGGYPFLKGFIDEMKKKSPGMMTLIALAISVAYIYSSAVVLGLMGEIFFWELATLVDIMLLGHWIEMKSIMGASRALEELARLMPAEAHKLMADGSLRDVPRDQLMIGDKMVVKPGEKIPADGTITDGETSVNEAMLTGESNPVLKRAEDKVIGGSVNGEGSITVNVKKMGKDSYISQMMALVKEAQESKSRTQDLANRAARWLVIIAVGAGAITIFIWLKLLNKDFSFALERAVTVLVISCPHALGLAVPLVVAVSTAVSARNGLLIRNRAAFERGRNIQAILFDKTGTLTEGKFGVTDIVTMSPALNEKELIKYAASVETYSEHPIAKGIVSFAPERFTVENFKAIPGKGAEARVGGKEVKVVSPGYLEGTGISLHDERIERLSEQGKTVIFVMIDGELKGGIALADIIRPESKRAIFRLKEMGIRCMMMTGDNKLVAKWVSEEIGLDEYFAEVLPEKKAEKVKEVQARGLVVAMTGDGVNDAPALAQADVGIAVGAGTDVAVETADIVLVRNNPLDVLAIISLARATYRKMAQNLGWATGYNAIAIPLAAGILYNFGILLSPAIGAIFMSLSTAVVAINARFLRIEK